MLSARLVLVRHGQSTWNAEGRLQGQADPPLSEQGRREAEALGSVLYGFPPERVLASDLRRARETAEAAGFAAPALNPVWREIDVGEWAGRPLAELPAGLEPAWRGGSLRPPGGETWEALQARVAGALAALREDGPWLVVTHGGVIRAAVSHVTGADSRRIAGPANGSVTVLEPGRLVAFAWTPNGRLSVR